MARFLALLMLVLTAFALPAAAQEKSTAAEIAAEESDDRGFLTRFLEENLSSAGRQVTISGFRGALSSRATFARITIADEDGVWLTLHDGAIQWNRSALLLKRVEIEELSAARIELPRLPGTGETKIKAEAQAFGLPELPVALDIKKIAAAEVDIGESVVGEAAVVSVDGGLSLKGGDGSARLSINRVDGKRGIFDIDAGFDNASRMLRVDVTLDEAQDGILANLVGIEGKPALAATIKGEGPLSDFAADVSLATDGQPRVTGNVALAEKAGPNGTPGTEFRLRLGGDVAALVPAPQRPFFGKQAQLLAQGWRGDDGSLSVPVLLLDTEALNVSGALTTSATGAPGSATLLLTLGEDAGSTTLPVRLPLGGAPTTVRGGKLELEYDATQGDGWTLTGDLREFAQAALSIDAVTLDGGGRVVLDGATLKEILGDITLDASGIAPSDPALAQAIGPTISGKTGFDWTPGNAVDLTGLSVTGADYKLDGDLRVDGLSSGITISGRIDAAYQDLSRLAAVTGQELEGRADLQVEGLFTLLGRAFDAEVALTGTDIAIGQPQLDRLLAGKSAITVSARRDTEGIELREATVAAARLTGEASGTVTSEGSDVVATLRLASLADVDPTLAGALQLDARLTGPAGARKLAVKGGATDLLTGVAQLDGALQGQTELTAAASESDAGWRIDSFRLSNPQLSAEAEGSLVPGAIDTALTFSVPQIGALQSDWSGALQGTGRVADTPDGLRLTLDGTGEGLRFGTADVGSALSGTTRFKVAALRKGDVTTLEAAEIVNDQVRIQADGTLAPAGTDLSGTVDIKALETFGRGWQGALSLQGEVSDDGAGKRRFDVTGTGQDLKLGQAQADAALTGTTNIAISGTQGLDGIVIEQGRVANDQAVLTAQGAIGEGGTDFTGTAKVQSLESLGLGWTGAVDLTGSFTDAGDGARQLTVSGTGQNLAFGQTQLDGALTGTTRLDLRGVERDGVFTIDAAELVNDRASVTATGTVGGEVTDITGTLRADNLAFLGRGLRGGVTADAHVVQRDGTLRLTATGEARGLGIGNPQADKLLAGVTRFDVEAAKSGTDITVQRLDVRNPQVSVTASGSLAQGITLDARLADLDLVARGFSGPATASGTVRQQDSTLAVDLALTGPGGTSGRVAGTAAQDFSTVDLAITGTSDAAIANPFLRVRSVEGPVNVDLRLNGAPTLQNLRGRVSLPSARFSDPKFGVRLDPLSLTADLEGESVRIDANGTLGEGGTVAVNGSIGLAGGAPIDLNVRLQNAQLRDPNLYEATVNGEVRVTGTAAQGPLISGRLQIDRAEIRIPSTGLGGAKDIPKIIHVGERPPSRKTRAKAGLTPFPGAEATEAGLVGPPATPPAIAARLDITISAPQQVFIRGRGVDAEMGGEIRLTGDLRRVIPIGSLELIRGRVDLLGKRFDLTDGGLELQGSMIPVIRLVAQTEQDGITTFITIDGEARDPKITFSSNPDMPQEEVLSQLLFGRGLENISPLQAAQLANAIAVLAGRGGEGIVDRLRSSVGLDDLDLGTDDEGNVTLRAGKYLTDKIYSDVEVGGDGQSRVNLNLDITKELRARGSVNDEGNSSIGLFYERDY